MSLPRLLCAKGVALVQPAVAGGAGLLSVRAPPVSHHLGSQGQLLGTFLSFPAASSVSKGLAVADVAFHRALS